MNLQIKKATSIIDISPSYINYYLGAKKDLDPQVHRWILQECVKLPTTMEGKQILSIMKTKKVIEISTSELKVTEELFNRYNGLFN